ncbi:uncharacterized protein LOC131618046 [Vicia villosa]|uniref:uncharacterized protein LOC131618046 n=1 Tax=Vicia villosa TaxID=3911 RepID=UPI00273BB679|nr:uncharacterized protein LOC131618046 [Vicia villosa]
MGDRKGDLRIYVISCFFFACTIGGGIFLCMYIFLPDSEAVSWYLFVGMAMVAIPWISWFTIFIYRCIRPSDVQEHHNNNNHGKTTTIWTPKSPQTTSPGDAKSPGDSPDGGGGERRVQFGAVVEMGDVGEGNHNNKNVVDDHHEYKIEQEKPPLVMVEH